MLRAMFYYVLFIMMIVTACGTSLTGNSSETNNGITVVAQNGTIRGKAPSYSSVFLYSNTYNPFNGLPGDSVITGESGEFKFVIQAGNYNLFCYSNGNLGAFIRISSRTFTDTGFTYVNDTIYNTLLPTGKLQGYSPYTDKNRYTSYLYIVGSPFIVPADSSGYFYLEGIPAGMYTIKRYSFTQDYLQTPEFISDEFTTTINVLPGETVTLD